ncbi:MAG: hypothetical protein ACR2JU_05230 [Nocardioidaceae bacterium]
MTERDEEPEGGPDTGSGDGGTMGTPSKTGEAAPPSQDQESNAVVSGGGVVGEGDDDPSDAAER